MQTMKINYDKHFDTLYVAFASNDNSYGNNTKNNIIWLRDMKTKEKTEITILSLMKKYKTNTLPELPIERVISIEDDILPRINQ